MSEKAIEAVAEVFRDAWRKPPETGDDVTSLSRDFAYHALAAAAVQERRVPEGDETEQARQAARIAAKMLDTYIVGGDHWFKDAADLIQKQYYEIVRLSSSPPAPASEGDAQIERLTTALVLARRAILRETAPAEADALNEIDTVLGELAALPAPPVAEPKAALLAEESEVKS